MSGLHAADVPGRATMLRTQPPIRLVSSASTRHFKPTQCVSRLPAVAGSASRSRRVRLAPRASAAAVALPLPGDKPNSPQPPSTSTTSHTSNTTNTGSASHRPGPEPPYPAVPTLPPPPVTGTLRDVVPYLLRLALAEKQLVWRFAAALGCMLCAKLAGA